MIMISKVRLPASDKHKRRGCHRNGYQHVYDIVILLPLCLVLSFQMERAGLYKLAREGLIA